MKTLTLRIPDLSSIQPDREPPFVLWDVVDQALLYHCFDFAIDENYEAVSVLCPNTLFDRLKVAIDDATLWPIEITLQRESEAQATEGEVFQVDHLPIQDAKTVPALNSAEELLAWHVEMSRKRLDYIWDVLRNDFPFITTGHRAFVHPDAILEGPYWIGDEAEVEAGAMIGAYSVIGHRSRVRAGATIEDSHLAPGADVAEGIHFNGHTVAPGLIFNHRKGILHREVDPEIVRFGKGDR